MTRKISLPVLLATLIGAVIGFVVRGEFFGAQRTVGTAVLNDFSFTNFIAQAGSSEWLVTEDKVYNTFPPLSRNPRIARRIVAQSTLLDSAQSEFATRFQRAAENWIASRGAMIKGEQSATRAVTNVVADGQQLMLMELPRRYYALGKINGVADFWCIADAGRVTVIISIIEGR